MNATASPEASQATSDRRGGFTLVELLTVMAVISLLVAMTAMMMGTVRESARKDQTRALLNTINEILMTKWESYATRPLPIVLPSMTDNESLQIPARESARVRLIMLRDLMRMEMPDRYSDVADAAPIHARAVRTPPAGTPFVPVAVTWTTPASVTNYTNRLRSTRTAENASSELLYLILSTTSFNGISAIETIPKRNIRDTDEDGMLEIVDAWGNAIRFIRWPAGYAPPGGMPISADEFDFLQVDWGYSSDTPPASLKPLLVSAGPDGVFNIRFTLGGPGNPETPYQSMVWPLGLMGTGPRDESAGRLSPYPYIDPYRRQYLDEGLPGELLNDASEEHLDNITNFNVNEQT